MIDFDGLIDKAGKDEEFNLRRSKPSTLSNQGCLRNRLESSLLWCRLSMRG